MQKAKDKLKAFAAMFRGTEAGEAAKKLELMYMAVLNSDMQISKISDVNFSIRQTEEGKNYVLVDTDQNIFDNADPKDYRRIARQEILKRFRGKVLDVGIDDAYINSKSANEYAYPANKRINEEINNAKMRASVELDNLLKISKFLGAELDYGKNNDVVEWRKYTTLFNIGGKFFDGEVQVKVTKSGKYFKDITKIKEVYAVSSPDIITSATSNITSSNISIRNSSENVNPKIEKFSLRSKMPPKKTEIAYKVFNQREDGNLYPLYINPDNNAPYVEVGKWYDADEGEYFVNNKNGRKYVKAQGGLQRLAYRPGWHSGSVPYLDHIGVIGDDGRQYLPKNFVWAEVEVSADKDYQSLADLNGTQSRDKQLDYIPEDGYYRYKTNSNAAADQEWYISGALKVNKILSDEEAFIISGKRTLRNNEITKDIRVSDRSGTVRKIIGKEKYFLPTTKDKVLTKMPEAAAFTSKEKMQDRWTSLLKVVNSLSF